MMFLLFHYIRQETHYNKLWKREIFGKGRRGKELQEEGSFEKFIWQEKFCKKRRQKTIRLIVEGSLGRERNEWVEERSLTHFRNGVTLGIIRLFAKHKNTSHATEKKSLAEYYSNEFKGNGRVKGTPI